MWLAEAVVLAVLEFQVDHEFVGQALKGALQGVLVKTSGQGKKCSGLEHRFTGERGAGTFGVKVADAHLILSEDSGDVADDAGPVLPDQFEFQYTSVVCNDCIYWGLLNHQPQSCHVQLL